MSHKKSKAKVSGGKNVGRRCSVYLNGSWVDGVITEQTQPHKCDIIYSIKLDDGKMDCRSASSVIMRS